MMIKKFRPFHQKNKFKYKMIQKKISNNSKKIKKI